MSVRVMTAVFDRYQPGPGGAAEMLVALALADHARDDGTHIYPSVAQLAQKTRQDVRTVQRHLRTMQACGWLILVGDGTGGRGRTRQYRINAGWLKGGEMSPFSAVDKSELSTEKGDTAPPFCGEKGCHGEPKRVTPDAKKGDTGVTRNRTVKNHQNHQGAQGAVSALPDGVPPEPWRRWLAEQRRRGRRLNADQVREQLGALAALVGQGHTAEAVVGHSIAGGYQTLYPPPTGRGTGGGPRAAAREDWWRSLEGVERKGAELGVARGGDDSVVFTARVWRAAGLGPWVRPSDVTTYRIYLQLGGQEIAGRAVA